MKAILEKRAQLKNRLDVKTELSQEAQVTYFSSWIYPAVHLLAAVPTGEEEGIDPLREFLARRLRLPLSVIDEALKFLESIGLLSRENGKLQAGSARMHLPHDSPLVSKHHINWRLKAIQDLEARREESLHYSSVVTISQKDARILRESLLKAIESAKAVIKDSKEECLYNFCLDLFEI